jgi:predicted site-specific integrase-resolvase
MDGLSHAEIDDCLDEIDKGLPDGRRYSNHNMAKDRAAVQVVVKHFDRTEAQAKEILNEWVKRGALEVVTYTNKQRREREKGLRRVKNGAAR